MMRTAAERWGTIGWPGVAFDSITPLEQERSVPIRHYRDLKVWQRGMELAVAAHKLTRRLPASERFGLADQIRRSAVSVPANIAEGHGREQRGDFLRFLAIARGSLAELETHLLIAKQLSYVTEADVEPVRALASETSRMLARLARAVSARHVAAKGTAHRAAPIWDVMSRA